MERVLFEQRFKGGDEENCADIWVPGSVSSRGKSKCKGPEAGEFLRLTKRPGRVEHVGSRGKL